MTSRDMDKCAAMRPYFEVVVEGLDGLVGGTDFFDIHAEDVVVEYIITVPEYPHLGDHGQGRQDCALARLPGPAGAAFGG